MKIKFLWIFLLVALSPLAIYYQVGSHEVEVLPNQTETLVVSVDTPKLIIENEDSITYSLRIYSVDIENNTKILLKEDQVTGEFEYTFSSQGTYIFEVTSNTIGDLIFKFRGYPLIFVILFVLIGLIVIGSYFNQYFELSLKS